MTFTRYDLHALQQGEINAAASHLSLPHLADFVASIGRAQAAFADGTLRTYLRDLVRQGWFEVVSPSTGGILRSGCSLVLVDKTVVFSFPEEPALLLAVGDLSLGFPVCAAMLTDRDLLLGLAVTDWGFSERHLPSLAGLIRATGWAPGPAAGPLSLVLGDVNFAHHAWNQLSALEEMVCGDLPDGIRMVATHQPFGPIHEIFPELSLWPLTYTPDTGLETLNAPGALFAPVGGRKITAGLVKRLLTFAETRVSVQCQALVEAISEVRGPVLWISVRTRNRTATNQHAMLTALGSSFLKADPKGAIIIDGFSLAADLASQPPYNQDKDHGVLAEDRAAAEALRTALDSGNPTKRVYVAVGLSISDSILLSQQADIYFCHHGTVHHKIGWFSSAPGVVHCNRAMLMATPAAWVAAQSEVAIPPLYLPPEIVQDADAQIGASIQFAHLLRWENYTITDIPAAIAAFFTHAAEANVSIMATQEDIMTYVNHATSADKITTPPHVAVARPPNRHLLTEKASLIANGILYTDFFRFVDAHLHPKSYFEVGTHLGNSVKAFTCNAVCVDPHFKLDQDVLTGRPETHFYQMSSDSFFAQHDLRSIFKSGPDVSFLDGMHRSDYLLRDFMNTERLCHRRSIIFMHDCLPVNARMSLRTHEPGEASEGPWQHAWTGDVWKIVPLLKKHRPDLKMFVLDCAPTGLVAVANLDPTCTALAEGYSSLVDELRGLDLETYSIHHLWDSLPVISSRSLVEHPEDLTLFLNIEGYDFAALKSGFMLRNLILRAKASVESVLQRLLRTGWAKRPSPR